MAAEPNFEVKFVTEINQHDQTLFQRHRCAEEIKKFLDFWQDEAVQLCPKIDTNENVAKEALPPTFEKHPTGVIWIPTTDENAQKAVDKVVDTIINDLDKNNGLFLCGRRVGIGNYLLLLE